MVLIQSLARAFHILDLFDDTTKTLSLKEISNKLDLNKSTVHSLLKTLKHYGYIAQDDVTQEYSLGWKLYERGNLVISQIDLKNVAARHLKDLNMKTNETVHLVIRLDNEAFYIDKINGHNTLVIYSRIGKKVPLHSSAVGKVLTAYLPDDKCERIFSTYDFVQATPQTITDYESFKSELIKVREHGYAMDKEENEVGIVCVAMPIYDYSNKVIAAVSVSTPKINFSKRKKKEVLSYLRSCVNEISDELGYKKSDKGSNDEIYTI